MEKKKKARRKTYGRTSPGDHGWSRSGGTIDIISSLPISCLLVEEIYQ